MKYKVSLKEVAEGGYAIYVPSLPGCVSYGSTIEEALVNVKEAAEGYLKALLEIGEQIPNETSAIEAKYEVEINV